MPPAPSKKRFSTSRFSISWLENINVNELPNRAADKTMSESDDKSLVAQILSSYLSNNTVAAK
jgi:hypothetical protein